MTTNKTPANREELIELRARAIMEHVWGDSEPDDVAREIAAATLEAEEAAGLAVVPVEPTSRSLRMSGYGAMLAASPYRKEG